MDNCDALPDPLISLLLSVILMSLLISMLHVFVLPGNKGGSMERATREIIPVQNKKKKMKKRKENRKPSCRTKNNRLQKLQCCHKLQFH